MIKSVCIFCASSQKVDQKYFDATKALAKSLLENNVTIQYGGGAVGLMGVLANEYISGNGKIIGVIPEFMMKMEWGNKNVSELIVVDDMHQRKRRMIQNVDAVIALPGGCGTLEELMEVITLKQLGKFLKPIVILNTDGFYDPLIAMLEKMIRENFMRDVHRNIWTVVGSTEEVVPAIENSSDWDASIIKIAQV